MLIDAATLIGAFAAGYGLRAWISARRRRAVRKAGETDIMGDMTPAAARVSDCLGMRQSTTHAPSRSTFRSSSLR